jgi:hypothetical protein
MLQQSFLQQPFLQQFGISSAVSSAVASSVKLLQLPRFQQLLSFSAAVSSCHCFQQSFQQLLQQPFLQLSQLLFQQGLVCFSKKYTSSRFLQRSLLSIVLQQSFSSSRFLPASHRPVVSFSRSSAARSLSSCFFSYQQPRSLPQSVSSCHSSYRFFLSSHCCVISSSSHSLQAIVSSASRAQLQAVLSEEARRNVSAGLFSERNISFLS